MQSRVRSAVALTAAAVLVAAISGLAAADPVDLEDDPQIVVGNTVWDLHTDPVTVSTVAIYDGPVDLADPDLADHLVNFGQNDMWWSAFLETPDAAPDYWGNLNNYDMTTAANGDVVLTGPVEEIMGLDVTGEFRFYAAGDLVRVMMNYTNPTAAPITVLSGTESYFVGDAEASIAATSSGDTTVTADDRWLVATDGGNGAPVLTMVWEGPAADLPAQRVEGGVEEGGELYTYQTVTVAPGATVHFAYFTQVTGYGLEPPMPDSLPGLLPTVIVADPDAAVASAVATTTEFGTFAGRLVAGLAPGTVVLNWGTVAAATPAAPATPVVTRPTFTG